jgi:DoxX-like family
MAISARPKVRSISEKEIRLERTSRGINIALWIIQGLLAALFLFAGGVKLILPMDEAAQQLHIPALFLRFIGLCEVLGAAGLILPGLLRTRTSLTPLAAAGLVLIMIGATTASALVGPCRWH